jgi:hypothetical protein
MAVTRQFDFDRSKLALSYDADLLQKEVREMVRSRPPYIHYNVIPLKTAGAARAGVTDFSAPDWTTWTETPLLRRCHRIRAVLASIECHTTNVRLLRLEAGGLLKEHCDPQLDLGLRNQVRLHVPVFTSPLVDFVLNGSPVPLKPGELWYLRLSDPHSVHNRGEHERIQLSIDVVVNDWIETMIVEGETA